MKRSARLALVFVVGIILLGNQPGAFACSFLAPRDPEAQMREDFRRAAAVFVGIATNQRDPNAESSVRSSGDPIIWTFDVESVQKGRTGDPQEVSSAMSGISCGFEFQLGRRYQVFAEERDGELHTYLGKGTHELAAGQAPFKGLLPTTGVGGGGAALLTLAAAAFIALVARRRA
jgi:hypothetical protein